MTKQSSVGDNAAWPTWVSLISDSGVRQKTRGGGDRLLHTYIRVWLWINICVNHILTFKCAGFGLFPARHCAASVYSHAHIVPRLFPRVPESTPRVSLRDGGPVPDFRWLFVPFRCHFRVRPLLNASNVITTWTLETSFELLPSLPTDPLEKRLNWEARMRVICPLHPRCHSERVVGKIPVNPSPLNLSFITFIQKKWPWYKYSVLNRITWNSFR